jgi:hypothetical protein
MRKPKQKPTRVDPVSADVTVRVDGKRWHRVRTLSASGPTDRHFTLETEPNGSTAVRFGDGVRGASASKASKVDIALATDDGNVQVSLRRAAVDPTLDQALWVAIRNRTYA